jgi:hypothetical protein
MEEQRLDDDGGHSSSSCPLVPRAARRRRRGAARRRARVGVPAGLLLPFSLRGRRRGCGAPLPPFELRAAAGGALSLRRELLQRWEELLRWILGSSACLIPPHALAPDARDPTVARSGRTAPPGHRWCSSPGTALPGDGDKVAAMELSFRSEFWHEDCGPAA